MIITFLPKSSLHLLRQEFVDSILIEYVNDSDARKPNLQIF